MKYIQQLMRATATTNTMTMMMIKVFDLFEPPCPATSANNKDEHTTFLTKSHIIYDDN
jgi:hypothetical protein